MIKDIKNKVEEIGIFFEKTGLTPMEARVFALLLLADPPAMEFFAIQEFLDASKSTISNALKRLMNEGRVDYITKPGDRKRYFRVSSQKWLEQIQESFATITPFVSTMKKVLALREQTDSPEFNKDLRHIQDYFLYLEEELPRIQAKWNKRQQANS
ncbi:DNA-binding transcriptional regulator GbsR (MarR family) [Lewinella marina]|uniref:Transcription regulator TrmB N-terminal domain-containing protein n=1 Tax=Neolewinella marina TaxID=438751 RepID=A0A2G0CDP8_9BACT|nr:helix-turn-helix domain-containing protein [Neolewinella marina]NJB85932.1 DNA-binding transcriptional regulator GbsR (MarR family) [Neolewinella marina]PHK98092.1 hypothetical protein CGL56_12955 [Neolewinella marina]